MITDNAELTSSPHKQLAVAFLRMVVAGKVHEAYRTYTSPEMRLHNVYVTDAASLEQAVAEDQLRHPHKTIAIQMTLEEGDRVMVLSHLHMTEGDIGCVLMHVFRFANDQIIEMWDFGQQIPENSPSKQSLFA